MNDIEENSELFKNPELRYLRSWLTVLLPRVSNYESCAGLYGIIQNMDEFITQLPLDENVKEDCRLFANRVYYIFSHTNILESFNKQNQFELIKAQIPPDAKPILKDWLRCQIYLSPVVNFAMRTIQINDHGLIYTDLIPKSSIQEIINGIEILLEIIEEEPSTKETLQPLLFDLVCNRESITIYDISDALNRIPPFYHKKLKSLNKLLIKR